MDNKINYKLINFLLVLLIVCLLYLIRGLWLGILTKIIAVIFPFLIAFAVAYAMYPYCKKLEGYGLPKWLAMGIIYFIIVGFIVVIGITVVPMLYDQVLLFLSNISAVITDISSKYEVDLGVLQKSISSISSDVLKNVGAYISDGAINIVNASINVVTNLIIVVAVSVYLLWDMDKIRDWVRTSLKKRKTKTYRYIKRLDTEISNYFSGLFKTMIIQFVEYTIVFALIGHPNYLVLSILAAVTTIIPYFGGLLVNILAVIIASVVSTELLILTILVCIICPSIDGYIIAPKVYGKTNQLPALVNIFAVFAGGVLGGFWGIVISLPVTIVLIALEHINFGRKSFVLIARSLEDVEADLTRIFKDRKISNKFKSRNYSSKGYDYAIELTYKNIQELNSTLSRQEKIDKYSIIEYDADDIV